MQPENNNVPSSNQDNETLRNAAVSAGVFIGGIALSVVTHANELSPMAENAGAVGGALLTTAGVVAGIATALRARQ